MINIKYQPTMKMQNNITNLINPDDLSAVTLPTADAHGLPNAAYTEAQIFAFERDNVLGKSWAALGFCDDYKEPGTVVPLEFMGLPLLISCDTNGARRVFHNVCSHRGMRLLTAKKKTNGLLVCPYHAWSYELNGCLKATPHIGGEGKHQVDGFCKEKNGLKEVRSGEWMGILFINLSGDAPAFEKYIAPLNQRYEKFIGSGANSLAMPRVDAGDQIQVNCNWKLAVENFCEAYHLPWIHPDLNSYSPLSKHKCFEINENFAGQITTNFDMNSGGRNVLPAFPDWPADKYSIGEYPTFYPNLLLGFQVNHFYALIIYPISENQSHEIYRLFYIGDGALDACFADARRANLKAWKQIFEEDVDAVEGLQLGRQSPGFRGGVFSPKLDTATHHFHKWVARKYTQAILSPG